MTDRTLIIGAGPFGLALSAYARAHGIEHTVVGEHMGFWKQHMPEGMLLRSRCDWHLDPLNEHTIDSYLGTLGATAEDVEPLSLKFYLDYCDWFTKEKQIDSEDVRVERLDHEPTGAPCFTATLDNGETISAERVVVAVGFGYFANIPDQLRSTLPEGRYSHTSELCDFSELQGKRVLIVGGRQSAFEWSALINEVGAQAIYMTYRHATPSFTNSDWSWVAGAVHNIATQPGWFRQLSSEEREKINHRQWSEGRLKLEPWLAPRITNNRTTLYPETEIVACDLMPDGQLRVTLSNGVALSVDHIVLATGYKVDVDRIPFLKEGNILQRLQTRNGFPVLDDHLESNIPGLFFTSMCATQDFGSFFGFTVSVRASAILIGESLTS